MVYLMFTSNTGSPGVEAFATVADTARVITVAFLCLGVAVVGDSYDGFS